MFITDQQLYSALHDTLQVASDKGLEPYWLSVLSDANSWAYQEILTALMRRGWNLTVINQWDRGAEFQRDLALWRCLTRQASMAPQTFGVIAIDKLDRRPDLKLVNLTIAGVWQDADQQYGQPQVGPGELTNWSDIPRPIDGEAEWWWRQHLS